MLVISLPQAASTFNASSEQAWSFDLCACAPHVTSRPAADCPCDFMILNWQLMAETQEEEEEEGFHKSLLANTADHLCPSWQS